MNNLQVQKLRMYLTLRVLLNANPAVLDKMPNGKELLTNLDAAIASIQSDSALQQNGLSELNKQKSTLRAALSKTIQDTSKKMEPYAAYIKDSALQKKVRWTKSDVARLTEEELTAAAKELYASVNAHLAKLAAYQLTELTQTAFLAEITQYEKSMPEIRKERQDMKTVTIQLANEVDDADEIIDQFDLLAELIRESDPLFYDEYKRLRKVVAGFKTAQLLAKVTEAETDTPIANATVTFTLNGNSEPELIKLTAAKGGFLIKSIEQGIYTVEIAKFGYQTQTLTAAIASDAPYNLNVKLVKSV